MKPDSKVAAKTIKQAQSFDLDQKKPKEAKTREERKHFPSLADRLAQSSLCIKNWRWPTASQDFARDLRQASVALYYPNAKGGPLLVDYVHYEEDKKVLAEKSMILKKRGFRYVVLHRDTEESEGLEALDRCMEPELQAILIPKKTKEKAAS